MMEIAIQKEGKKYLVYVEGVSWKSLTNYFIEEAVNVYLLVYIINGRYISHDKNIETSGGQLSFLRQNMPVKQILELTAEMDLDEPYECKLGNAKFFLRHHFLDAYELNFNSKSEAQQFISALAHDYSDLQEALEEDKSYSTSGLTDDFVKSRNFDRFMNRRYDRWNDIVVKEYEQMVKKGLIRLPKW